MADHHVDMAMAGGVPAGASESLPADDDAPTASPFERLKGPALWLVMLILVATVLLWLLGLNARWEPPYLNFALHVTFVGGASLMIAVMAMRSFRLAGNWSVLWLGAGALTFGVADVLGYAFLQWVNVNAAVSANNLSVLFSALLHILGAFSAYNGITYRQSGTGRTARAVQVYLGSLAIVACITLAALRGLLPPFFVQGQGGTPWRQMAVAEAGLLFLVAGLSFLSQYRRSKAIFLYWYALGLLLISLAMAGTLVTTATGSPLSWLVRIAQLLSGLYLLIAALVTMSQARARKLRPEEMLASFFWQREANLRRLFDSVMDAIIVTDQNHCITGWNPAAEAIYGWHADEVSGKPITDVLQTEYPSGLDRQQARADLLSAGEWSMEMLQICRDGRQVAIMSSASVLKDESGQFVGVVEVNRNITERKRADEEIKRLNESLARRASALAAANKELEAFAYSVSHDLRAPLRGIDGFAQALLEDYAGRLDAEGQQYLGMVRQNAHRMSQLIDDLLAFSRLGRQAVQKRALSPAGVARQAWEELQADWLGRPVELLIGNLPTCEADPALLQQVYLNLLDNALKFSRGRSPAIIEVGFEPRDGGETVFYVKDNGAGFDMQYHDRLFGVFQRLHGSEEYEGTGVGLAIVQRIIHRHGGQIWAEGKVDGGATFYFTFGGNSSE